MKSQALAAILGAALAFGGSYLSYSHNTEQLCEQTRASLSQEISELKENLKETNEKVAQLRDERAELIYEMALLRIELKQKYASSQMLKDYQDGKKWPSWTKIYDPETESFRYWHINEAYERMFGHTNEYFLGKEDYDVWPFDVAEGFRKNDLEILRTKGSECEREMFPLDAKEPVSEVNPLVWGDVCKWYHKIDGKEAVSGDYKVD